MINLPENKHLKFFIIIAYVILGYWFFVNIFPTVITYTLPFLLAFVIASVTAPFVRFMRDKLKFKRWLANTISLLFVLFVIVGVLIAAINKIVTELLNFFAYSPTLVTDIGSALVAVTERLTSLIDSASPEITLYLNDIISNLTAQLMSMATPLAQFAMNSAKNMMFSLPQILIFCAALILSCIFMTNDYDKIKRNLFNQIPEGMQEKVLMIKKYALIAVAKYLRGMTIILSITFCELFLGFLILRIPYAFALALLIAIVDFLPILGTGTILIPWAVIALLSGNYKMAISIGVLYIAITVIRQLIEPKVMSKSLGIYPLATLFAMYVGLKAFGLGGMIVGPITILILVYLQRSGVIKFWKYENE